ncbi:MAG: hypothetical protein CEO22_49 [Candidatus Berkelbacteria bacterium Gr01-1014_85]|uniref:Uncharacterized protein n=1 Tax=Candidatus Berkelbacteria bacterium Gr01-1014_85 TaxID=2017150 RepID=A0A554JE31_9BACT|nr:MAG: hypothetical protein CEO22_49 [Candidatus Berkelbacteria bacterium Gr01-1014_85]
MISCFDSWASPYAPELHIIGDNNLLDLLEMSEVEKIAGVSIVAAKSGNKSYWRVGFGGEWVLVKVPGYLRMDNYATGRQPVDGMKYLPILAGESFTGHMSLGKRRTFSRYAVTMTSEGVTLTPVDFEKWGDRAKDITVNSVNPTLEPAPTATPKAAATSVVEQGESMMAIAMRKAGLI